MPIEISMSRDRGVLKNKQQKQSNNTVQVKIDFSWTGISKWHQYYALEVKFFLILDSLFIFL